MEVTNFKLISKIYLRPVNCFDLNFVFGTSWWKSPTPGISSLSIWLFFFHPNRHSVPEKAKKSRKNLPSMAATALGILLSWPFFSTTWPSYFYFCTSIVRSRAQKSWRKWWWCYQKHNTNNNLYKNGCDFTQSPDSDIYLQIDTYLLVVLSLSTKVH